MDWLYLIGRVLFAMVFIGSGATHFTSYRSSTEFAASKGVPAAGLAVPVTGLMILIGGASVLLGVWMEIGTWLIVLFLVPTAFMMHNFWTFSDPTKRANQQAHFMKNLSMAGGALVLYWVVQTFGYGPFTLGEPMG